MLVVLGFGNYTCSVLLNELKYNNNNHFFSANILEDRAQWRNKTKGLGRLVIKNNA